MKRSKEIKMFELGRWDDRVRQIMTSMVSGKWIWVETGVIITSKVRVYTYMHTYIDARRYGCRCQKGGIHVHLMEYNCG